MKVRYSELPKKNSPTGDVTYNIKSYLTEVSSEEIDKAYMESNFTKFVLDLSNGAPKEEIEKILKDLRSNFAILSIEEQQVADVILEDILSVKLKYQPGKLFIDYMNMYNTNILLEKVDKLCIAYYTSKCRKNYIHSIVSIQTM